MTRLESKETVTALEGRVGVRHQWVISQEHVCVVIVDLYYMGRGNGGDSRLMLHG